MKQLAGRYVKEERKHNKKKRGRMSHEEPYESSWQGVAKGTEDS
jgi:hypothetical protein